jgi:hypothetical protein
LFPAQPFVADEGISFIIKFSQNGQSLVPMTTTLFGNPKLHYTSPSGLVIGSDNNIYVAGTTDLTIDQLPNAAALQSPMNSAVSAGGGQKAFVAKFDQNLQIQLITAFNGTQGETIGNGIALDAQNHVWITGMTSSSNFPVTDNALQPTYGGATTGVAPNSEYGDAFVAEIKTDQTNPQLLYCTYLGGSGTENENHVFDTQLGGNIAVDANYVYVVGDTGDVNSFGQFFVPRSMVQPVTGFMPAVSDQNPVERYGFLIKLRQQDGKLVFGKYFGETASMLSNDNYADGIAVDNFENIYITGESKLHGAFVAQLDKDGNLTRPPTYLGQPYSDATAITLDSKNPPNLYITGATYDNFPLVSPVAGFGGGSSANSIPSDAFVAVLKQPSPSSDPLLITFSTYLGGAKDDGGDSIALGNDNAIYVGGVTKSTDFFNTFQNSLAGTSAQSTFGGGYTDGFVAKITLDQTNSVPTNCPCQCSTPVRPTGSVVCPCDLPAEICKRHYENINIFPGGGIFNCIHFVPQPIEIGDPVEISTTTFLVPAGWSEQPSIKKIAAFFADAGNNEIPPLFLLPELKNKLRIVDAHIQLQAGAGADLKQIRNSKSENFFLLSGSTSPEATVSLSGVLPQSAHPGDIFLVELCAHYQNMHDLHSGDTHFTEILTVTGNAHK